MEKQRRLGKICIASLHSRDLAGKDLAFGTFPLEPLDRNHSLQHMPRELPNLRVRTISPRSSRGAWAGLSVLVSIRTRRGKRCPVSTREGIEATMITVITIGMNDHSGDTQWVLYTQPDLCRTVLRQ